MVSQTRGLSRRQFFAMLAAGWVVTAEGLWMPGTKLISIPKPSSLAAMRASPLLFAEAFYDDYRRRSLFQDIINQRRSQMLGNLARSMVVAPATLPE